ncbi:MAG: S8 family serine peptidase [Bacteroidota bacterium]
MNPSYSTVSLRGSKLLNLFLFVGLLFLSSSAAAQLDLSAKLARADAGSVLSYHTHRIIADYQKDQGLPITAIVNEMELNMAFYPSNYIQNEQGDFACKLIVENMAVQSDLEAFGIRTIATSPNHNIIEAYVSTEQLQGLEAFSGSGLKFVRPLNKPHLDGGSTTNQADFVLEAYRVRNLGPDNFDGTGVSIGVLSDSYDFLSGASAGVTSGDLPSVTVLQEGSSTDEGRAMIELIFDIAPGSTYFFATANGGQSNYANNIQSLADNGCSVIVDDVVYLAEPFYQDGVLAQKIDEITNDEDVIYFSSAGNRADEAFESTTLSFVNESTFGTTVPAYDFDTGGGTDFFQQFTLEDGEELQVSFQWDEPWFSSISTDMDIVISEDGTNTILSGGLTNNLLSDEPVEIPSYTNGTGSQQIVNVYIYRAAGTDPARMKYVSFGDVVADEYHTNSPTINPHAAADKAVAVAASVFYERSIESFSSIGPSTFLFESDGTPKGSPESRATPDMTSTDGVNTTFFGSDTSCDDDSDPNFFGTSAAAPNAAAVAALIRQANPGFTRDQVYNAMINTAQDLGNSITLEGAGLINAFRAIYGTTAVEPDLVETFESSTIDNYWETNSTLRGRILVTDENGPFGGSYHLTMDTWCGINVDNLNEAILHINADDVSSLDLSFDQREFGDEDDVMSASFTGSENSDGVAFSVDGTNWFRLVTLTGTNSSATYANKSFDLRNFAISNGLTLDSDVQVKFQQNDGFPITSDGMAFDNVQITATVLSVDNLELVGSINNGQADLVWTTSAERNNAGFEVEHSIDGIEFNRLQPIQAIGNSDSPTDYAYTHTGMRKGANYYRIQQKDFDGKIAYSNIIVLELNSDQNSTLIWPNPAKEDQVQIETYLVEAANVHYSIYSPEGQLIRSWNNDLPEGATTDRIDLNGLAAGFYMVETRIGSERLINKLIVR